MTDVDRIIADLQATQPERNARLAEHRAAQHVRIRTAHIIDNDDTAITYCGRMLAVPADPTDTAAILLAGSDVEFAIFNDVDYPDDACICFACHMRYEN